mmetsp:Transcript_75247/g.243610  ORF Transcript_75247/g.243610 Transcript_75247/m.243610 type:complete len:142 (+) Transcript_75247:84-509(+)
MVETLIIELFFCQGPRSDGALGEADVARLNFALARRYHSLELRAEEEECGASQPPPEPFPTGSMRYPAFRTQVHRALARLAADAAGREKATSADLLREHAPHTSASDEGTWGRHLRRARGRRWAGRPQRRCGGDGLRGSCR